MLLDRCRRYGSAVRRTMQFFVSSCAGRGTEKYSLASTIAKSSLIDQLPVWDHDIIHGSPYRISPNRPSRSHLES